MSGLTGDFAKLERLVRSVQGLGSADLRARVLGAAAPVLANLVRAEFQLSTGPRGARWRRLKRPRARSRPNKGGPLFDDGKLREQASTVQVVGEGLMIFVTHPGALTHLYGRAGESGGRDARGRFTAHGAIPARPYLPLGAMPGPWMRGLNAAATATFKARVST